MSAANVDHFDSLSLPNRPFTSSPSLASFQPDPRATLSWPPYRVDTPTAVSGTNPNHLESLSFSNYRFASRPVPVPFQSDVMASDTYSSNNVRTSWVTTSANPKGSISKRDWNKHRALITKLYAKRTLPEVMKFMESEYDFRATVKMYKMRIKQWGLDKKNNKENEMRAIYSAMAEVLLGNEHPICYISGWLTSVDPSESNDILGRCKGSVADHFETFLGPMHRSTLNARMMFFEDRTRKEEWLQDLLGNCENDLGSLDVRTWYVRFGLAHHCLNKHKYLKAKKLGQELAQAQLMRIGAISKPRVLYIIAISQHALGETKSAESTLREAIDLTGSERQGRVMYWLTTLEGWLLEKGQWSSAAQARDKRRKVLESMNSD
ncbi:hypothetical protein OEA41_010386 [Lepraria neglecta]|uniref:Clr5 domain-containing protein n=1 Tax=Lepraria neglecta TaxID=209136 RepID=A0AAE0DFI6_9LECA|nr:hypothetical protein OEA41_010386 [Lepraria neglecta]